VKPTRLEGRPTSGAPQEGGGGFGLGDILFPFLLPIKGVAWIGGKLKEAAEQEITDESRVHEDLLDLQMRLEMEEISEEEFRRREQVLVERLEAIRKYKEEKGR